ncbi:MAG: DnaJ domain-containing protein [Bdellovibrionales bacterium]|nr:DnaJ domain-containing protein [Bdellovibrionales bacterium]
MPSGSNKYRDHLYQYREHPDQASEGFSDHRDSFFTVYLSVLPFLAVEYYAELSFKVLPSGLIFPFGFLLFWAFFYTYYKPGFLEKRLSNTDEWDVAGIPAILVGVLVWFVKVTVVSLAKTILSYIGIEAPQNARRQQAEAQAAHRRMQQERAFRGAQAQERAREQKPRHQTPPPPQAPSLPSDIQQALATLGLSDCRNWQRIHRRYRELAKQYHPDLNPHLTDVGRRFMMYDAAYRKLSQVKNKYFAA